MASLTLQCGCGKQYRVPETARGKRVKCPACQQVLVIPLADTTSSADVPARGSESPSAPAPGPTAASGLGSFLDENLRVAPALERAPAPAFPLPKSERSPLEQERELVDAELAELKEQMKDEFLIGHAIIQARGRLNKRIEEAQANAPVVTHSKRPSTLITAIGFFTGGFAGVLLATVLHSFWPQRTTRARVTFGQAETAGLDAAAAYGRSRAVSASQRSDALHTLIRKEISWGARMTALWGSSLCALAVSLILFLVALGMNWVQPLLGVLFVGVGVFGWRFVGRELGPLNDALADYPHLAARFGRPRVPRPVALLATPAYLLLLLGSAGWVGWSTYDWGRKIVEPMLRVDAPPTNSPPAASDGQAPEKETPGKDSQASGENSTVEPEPATSPAPPEQPAAQPPLEAAAPASTDQGAANSDHSSRPPDEAGNALRPNTLPSGAADPSERGSNAKATDLGTPALAATATVSPPAAVDLRGAYARDFTVTVDNGNQALLRVIVRANFVCLLSAVYADAS